MSKIECITLKGNIIRVPKSQLILRPAAYGIIVHQERMLLMKMRHTGKYHLPGGGMHIGEPLEATLVREVREETGIEIHIHKLAHFKEEFFYYDPSGRAYHGLHFFYVCTPETRNLIDDEKVNDSAAEKPRWIDMTELRPVDFQLNGDTILQLAKNGIKRPN